MRVENLNFFYKDKHILNNISFEAKNGEIIAVLGINGAGKSTLMKCLAGVLKPNSGKIYGNEKIGYLTQNIINCDELNVFEMVLLGRVNELSLKISDDDKRRICHILEHLGITHLAKRHFCELSGGQQRLVLIAQIFVKNPKIMLLDEPSANLDYSHQKTILSLIFSYTKRFNSISVINIHNVNQAFLWADKILVLNDGKICFFDIKEKLDISLLSEVFGVSFEILTNKNGKKFIANF